jgi:hypothetical protein
MAKRRKITPVTLNTEGHVRLERLWFYFGNYGAQTNHRFIQGLLEHEASPQRNEGVWLNDVDDTPDAA